MGYTGGSKANPTYYDLGNHTEAFEVDFDPKQVSYNDLLALFWEGHRPFTKTHGTQYKPVVFFHDEAQHELAEASKARLAAASANQVHTEVLPLKKFYRAEDYHQKYYLRHNRILMAELKAIFPGEREFVDSTLSARLSSYSSHYGSATVLERELASYGLSAEANTYLEQLAPDLEVSAGGAACGLALSP